MSERAWYQDGWVMLCVVLFTLCFGVPLGHELYRDWQQSQKPLIRPQMAGYIKHPVFGSPTFELSVWHQNSGNLQNGTLMVILKGELAKDSEGETRMHSFDLWEPNREKDVQFSLPITHFDLEKEITISVLLATKHTKTFLETYSWIGDDWVEDSQ